MQEAPTPRSASSFPPEQMVNASELREFIFCERAWFLNRQGFRVSPDALAQRAAGMVFHETRARAATKGRSQQALWWALVLALLGVALLVLKALMDTARI
jgi:hypothetical protein